MHIYIHTHIGIEALDAASAEASLQEGVGGKERSVWNQHQPVSMTT
jgi:hypothetical protein